MTSGWTVRRIRTDDGARLRVLRLQALRTVPMAFTELHADAVRLDDGAWAQRAARGAAGDEHAVFIAERAGTGDWLGMMGGHVEAGVGAVLISVYVRESARGTGASHALIRAVEGWARDAGHDTLSLRVHEDNLAARRFYESAGYSYTGRRDRYEHGEDEWELVMAKRLPG